MSVPVAQNPPVDVATLVTLLRGAESECVFANSGASMGATIPHGAEIRIHCGTRTLRAGDVVVFRADDRLVAHRVIAAGRGARESRWLITRGDSMTICDPPVASTEVLGIVTAVRRGSAWTAIARSTRRPGWRGVAAAALDRSVALAARLDVRAAAWLIRGARAARRVRARFVDHHKRV